MRCSKGGVAREGVMRGVNLVDTAQTCLCTGLVYMHLGELHVPSKKINEGGETVKQPKGCVQWRGKVTSPLSSMKSMH